jgi:orotate phosphoribosyltransferase
MGSLLDNRVELLAGLELGGIPLATAISLDRGIPTVFVRKHAKSYGTLKAIEGPSVSGRYVVVIEDVVTTGGAIIESVARLRDAGAVVEKVVCAIWRGTDLAPLTAAGLDLCWAVAREDLDAVNCSR